MKVKCVANTGAALSADYLEAGNAAESQFDLSIGKVHTVYGMCLWRGCLWYLVIGAGLRPNWYPAGLFDVTDRHMPRTWRFNFLRDDADESRAVWGYEELAEVHPHYQQLVERAPAALQMFERRKTEIDAEALG